MAIFVSGANEFERWAELQRARYAVEYIAALDACATEATARGEHDAAVVWWRRLAAELVNSRENPVDQLARGNIARPVDNRQQAIAPEIPAEAVDRFGHAV